MTRRRFLLALAHLRSPGKRAVKRACVYVCMSCNEFIEYFAYIPWYLKLVTDVRESGGVSMEDVVFPMATIALASSNEISNCQLVYSC